MLPKISFAFEIVLLDPYVCCFGAISSGVLVFFSLASAFTLN